MQPLRDRLKQATRDAILEAANAVFSERGFSGARVEEIAERAGVSVGTLYNYFDARRAILDAVLEASWQDLAVVLERELLPAAEPFASQLERFVAIVLRHVEEHFRLYAILVEEELESGRAGAGKRPALLRVVFDGAERLVAGGVASGELRAEDAAFYPALLVGMFRGVFMRRLCGGEAPIAASAGPLVRLFLGGVLARADGAGRKP